ncbi:DEAD/DEAH box helicase [Nocardioides aestuarii]|uniref:SNF2-related protein n=1 Tax=Nocardioides aestuarii TaxID=252231 RepID=A0ABW4TN19_9ACTN
MSRLSFVPVSGPATFRAADSPREGVVEFTGGGRTVAMPIRGALPVLTRAPARDEAHPSVRLIAGAALLGLRIVAAGGFEPDGATWRPRPGADDAERLRRLAGDDEPARQLVDDVVAAVIDAVPRSAPAPSRARPVAPARPRPDFRERLATRLRHHEQGASSSSLAQLVRLSLRIEADEEELRAGAVRVVPQVHDEHDPMRLCDAALLWTGDGVEHGFGDRARTHAAIALRSAAEAWSPLDRLLELRVPDQITLDTDELVSLLDGGVAALGARGVDVMWPRSLGRDLTATAVLDRRPGLEGPQEAPLQTGMLTQDALFSFNWQLALHGDPLTDEEMDQLAASATPVLRLRGQWAVVDPSLARKARKRLIRTATPAQAVAAALSGVAEVEGSDADASEVIVGASLLKVRDQLLSAVDQPPVEVPAGLTATLRDYQRQGLTWLDQLTSLGLGACLADDMGLGKTITLIALALHRAGRDGGSGPTLVVCPASLLGNWQAEVEKFAPGVPVRRFHGSARDLAGLSGPEPGFVLTTYGTMRVDAEVLAGVPWDLVVADEAQHVKNSRSATARALRTIPSKARVALTGTPVENELTELWSLLDWATPGLLGSRQAFRRVWAAPIESGVDPAVTARFRELVSPFLLRRRKSDPGIAPELPPRTDTDHLLSLTREQVVLYEAFVRDAMDRIERADEHARRGLVLAMLTGLKQICNHPSHFLKQGSLRKSSEKTDLLDEIVGTVLAEDGAVLVFTQYVAMARLLAGHLDQQGVPHQLLHGGTPVRDREAMVARFQSGDVPVFLLSLKAGGTGLNLTQADHVVHFDRWWNPAVEEQASDRAHRIGQTRPVQVHRMITTGTIEQRVAELLQRKQALADAVLVGGEGALTELTDRELRDLVTLRPDAGREPD